MTQTAFNPSQDGFDFANDFESRPIADIALRGLCGGMIYTALDYLNAGRPCPRQPHVPSDGSPLQSHIYQRNLDAWTANLGRWVELTVNPFGWRNDEFFKWGYEQRTGSQLAQLRTAVDAGRNVPLCLFSHQDGGNPANHHVVLGIGYDLGRFDGTNHAEDICLLTYDPNRPSTTSRLRPDLNDKLWREEGTGNAWRTYFVDQNYRPVPPPNRETPAPTESSPTLGDLVTVLTARICTGDDDLRGGNDNANIIVEFTDGLSVRFDNINHSQRWVDRREQCVDLTLNPPRPLSHVRAVTLETTSGGGLGGDNWNIDLIELKTNVGPLLPAQTGHPLHRFTGDRRTLTFIVR